MHALLRRRRGADFGPALHGVSGPMDHMPKMHAVTCKKLSVAIADVLMTFPADYNISVHNKRAFVSITK